MDESEELDDGEDKELLLDVDESESEGSGSKSCLVFFLVGEGRPDWYVLGVLVKVDKNDMVSGKDDTDDVSIFSVFLFCNRDFVLVLVCFNSLFVRTIWHECMSLVSVKCLLCRFRDCSCSVLVRFLIVEGTTSSSGKKAFGDDTELSEGSE